MGARQSDNLHPKTWWANLSRAACASLLAGPGLASNGTLQSASHDRDWSAVAIEMGLPPVPDAKVLVDAGTDIYGRRLRLSPETRDAWQEMRAAARADGVELVAISGYRSRAKQVDLVRAKLRRGMALREALSINAVPGYSEHHGGYALDIGTPGSPAAEEVFEHTAAFRWLQAHASAYGFSLSYPRGNPRGIRYEPWHWAWHDLHPGATATSEEPDELDTPEVQDTLSSMVTRESSCAPSDAPPGLVASADASPPTESMPQTPVEAAVR